MKGKKTNNSGSVKIDSAVYADLSKYCIEKGIKVSFFVTQATKEKLEKEKQN